MTHGKYLYRFAAVVLCGLLTALLAGCGKPKPTAEPPQGAEPAPEENPVNAVFTRADQLLSGGDTNAAIARIEAALSDPELAEHRQHLFNGMIRLLIYTSQLDEAKKRMREAYRSDETLARGGVGLVYRHLADSGNNEDVIAWTEEILAIETLPTDIRQAFRGWNLLAYVYARNDEKMLAIVDTLLQGAPAGGAVGLIGRTVDLLFEQQRPEAVARILQLGARSVTSDPDTQNLLTVTRLRLLTARKEWEALDAAFPAAAARLPDNALQRLLRQLQPALLKDGRVALADRIIEEIIEKHVEKTQAFSVAARQWIESAVVTDKPAVPVRLERLQRAKLPARELCNFYVRYFYDLINLPEVVAPMKEVGLHLAPLAEDDDTRNRIRTMVLDASFVLEDYATALRMLQEGIAGRDEAWHAMAISKVKAHQALQAGQPREAVKYFREFMVNVMSAKDEDTSDPATRVVHTKEMILGRNAKRIGDILMTIPDAEGAAKAYAEARDYYTRALETTQDQPATREIVLREMAEVPK